MADLANAAIVLVVLMGCFFGVRWLAKETAQILSKWWW